MFGLGVLSTIVVGGLTLLAAAIKISNNGKITNHDRDRINDDLV